MTARLASGDHRHEENAGGEIRCGDPENRQLQMPGAGDVERQNSRQIKAKKIGDFRTIMFRRPTHQCLQEKQQRHDEEKSRACALCRREHHFIRRTKRNALLLATVPAEKIPASERGEQKSDAAEQGGERQHTPNDGFRSCMIVHE